MWGLSMEPKRRERQERVQNGMVTAQATYPYDKGTRAKMGLRLPGEPSLDLEA